VVQDLVVDAANLAAIAEQRAWDGDIASEEFALAMRADAWADQVKALAASFLQLVAETPPPTAECLHLLSLFGQTLSKKLLRGSQAQVLNAISVPRSLL
jgi:hypothetical protein